jgi:uncharacterized lipoprotein
MNSSKIFFITLVLGGCALSPQTVIIAPVINTPAAGPQSGRAITIAVNDARNNNVIGTRGGVYRDTAHITADTNMTTSLKAILSNALRGLGYSVVDNSSVSLTVDVAELRYNATGEPNVTAVEIAAAVNAACRNGSLVMNNSYRVTDKQEVLKAPSGGRNQELINATLGTALQRMMSDPKLFECLSRS